MYISGKYTGVVTLSPFLYLTFKKKIRERKKDRVSCGGILFTNLH
jgi:hypothetical protein